MTTVYLDHAATTPLREEVRDAMAPYLGELFGNPSSTHGPGRRTAGALERARERVAEVLGAAPDEVLFTRGGTESDNLAVLGRAALARRGGRRPVVAHGAAEHSAVYAASRAVEDEGGRRIELPLDGRGRPLDDALERALEARPDVLSLMWVNNETGVIHPVQEVARRAREAGVTVHTDAVQAVGKLPVRVDETPVDLLTATGHKINGPRGTGILYLRRGTDLVPLIHGGGQERGLRPGTEDVAGAVGMAEALGLAVEERVEHSARVGRLRDRLECAILDRVPDTRVHGAAGERSPHILSLGIGGVDQDLLLAGLDLQGVACSGGSACNSGAASGAASSRALRALHASTGTDGAAGETGAETGLEGWAALRFSFGRESDEEDVDRAAEATALVVGRLRGGAP